MQPPFADRATAGQSLADRLGEYAGREDVVVLGLPRGGVPVAAAVAEALRVPMDLFLVRKLGVPGHEELAVGAIATGGVRVLNEPVAQALGISPETIDAVTEVELAELERRERAYRGARPALSLRGRTVILVDDGLATGATMRAAVRAVRRHGPARVVVAVPVAAPDSHEQIRSEVDDTVCLLAPTPFLAVGAWYQDFSQTTDEEVRDLVRAARRDSGRGPAGEAAE